MAKLTLSDLSSIQQSAVSTVNANSAAIEEAFENTLSRDGTSPNSMEADLDMNSKRILNLPEAASGLEPIRLKDLNSLVGTDVITVGVGIDFDYETVADALLVSSAIPAARDTIVIARYATDYPLAPARYIRGSSSGPGAISIGGEYWEIDTTGSNVNICWFGAKLDGVVDDTAAIQAALDTEKDVFHPGGTAKVSDCLKLRASGQQFTGVGLLSGILSSGTHHGIVAPVGILKNVIADLTLYGVQTSETGNPTGAAGWCAIFINTDLDGIFQSGTPQESSTIVERVYITGSVLNTNGWTVGIRADESYNNIIKDCNIDSLIGTNAGFGYGCLMASSTIQNCTFRAAPSQGRHAIYTGGENASIRNNKIIEFQNNEGLAVNNGSASPVYATTNIRIEGNSFDSCLNGIGFDFQGSATGSVFNGVILNNVFYNTIKTPVSLHGSPQIIISNNIFDEWSTDVSGSHAVRIADGSDKALVTNNIFRKFDADVNSSAVWVTTSDDVLIVNNTISAEGALGSAIKLDASSPIASNAFIGPNLIFGSFTVDKLVNTEQGSSVSIGNSPKGTGEFVLDQSPTITTPNIIGSIVGDDADTGSVGEYRSVSLSSASAVSLTTGSAANVTSVTLPAGDWDVSSIIYYKPSNIASVLYTSASLSTTPATIDTTNGLYVTKSWGSGSTLTNQIDPSDSIPQIRFVADGITPLYLVAKCSFTSTMSAYGIINARRVR